MFGITAPYLNKKRPTHPQRRKGVLWHRRSRVFPAALEAQAGVGITLFRFGVKGVVFGAPLFFCPWMGWPRGPLYSGKCT